ncbi:MAG TPA: S8 family peptidase [Sphingomicrobium sp.]|nr:S8 family peptidase [Sphingomicrobium sp.]
MSNAIAAYNEGYTGRGVKIGIIDSGINPDLSEFSGRIDNSSADVAGNRGVSDEGGHGTAVSAVAAAARNDSSTMGVAFNATIVSMRTDKPGSCATEDGCEFYDPDIAAGIDAARVAGVKVINLSLGGSEPGTELLDSMRRAVEAGIVLVIAAGNDGESPKGGNPDPFALLPAQTFDGSVIIAGSVGVDSAGGIDTNVISDFSNRAGTGAAWYLAALGHRDRAPDQTGTQYLWSGTSFSAPTISGAVALLAQAFPNLSGQQIVEILFSSADDLGAAGIDSVYGNGRLDIGAAMQPIGTTSLAGTESAVSTYDNGTLPAVSGDAGTKGSFGAIVLDGYSRAYALNLAKTLRQAPQPARLSPALQASLRGFTVGAGPVSVAMTLRQSHDLRRGFALERLGVGPEDARRSHLIAGQAIARLDPDTAVALGFGESAKAIEQRLTDAETGAFLIARDGGMESGFQSDGRTSFAVRRNLGPVNLTVSGETGAVWEQGERSDLSPTYRLGSVSVDRSFGSLRTSLGVSRLDERETVLGARMANALGGGGSTTTFLDLSARRDLGDGFSAGIAARHGWTSFAGGDFQTSAVSVDLLKSGLFSRSDRFGLRVAQPLRVASGGFGMMLPTGYDYATGAASNGWTTLSLTPSGREVDAELSYGSSLFGGSGWLDTNLFARKDPGHVADSANDYGAAIRFTLGF